ncbi:DUF2809 domain-containing protein [Streptomyces argenteolus]|uniref:DUF2809 domain-containing protein n=1 Tax=Streptomyces argenteolus TaxID=67274 RepID=A0ABW6X2I6_9ACTN
MKDMPRARAAIPRTAVIRATAVAVGLVTVAAGLGVRSAASGGPAAYVGDALYATLVHILVTALAPKVRPSVAAGIAVAVSWVVELAQLTGVPAELSARSTVARLVLGSTFNAPDLFWYVVGACLAWAVHSLLLSRSPRSGART